MGKAIVLILAGCGIVALLNTYYPNTWKTGFLVQGHLLPFAFLALGIGLLVVYKVR